MIYLPKVCGTCDGSTRALNKVYEIYEREEKKDNPKRICIYKEILHNNSVIEEFKKLGIETINDLNEVTSDDILIIRAHGEGKSTYDYLKENNIEYVDATCIKVQKIHEKIFEKYNAGYEIIIIGDEFHPEIIGSNGWCNNEGIIVRSPADVVDLKMHSNKIFVTCQTTIEPTLFEEIITLIENKYGSDNIEVYNACCRAVKNIMESSIELAKKMDLMFVIGGTDSSNTEVIRQNVSEYAETYKFSDINVFSDFILRNDIDENKKIGITGGASTPIKEICNYKYILEFLLFYKKVCQQLKNNQKNINDSLSCISNHDTVLKLIDDFKDLNQGGKYIRGILIALGYFLSSHKDDSEYLNLAYAYEMFQTAILVHDDIIDNAKIRREKETIPRRICRKYLDLSNDATYHEDVLKLANSLGICAGDYGFFEANKLIVKNYSTNPHLADILIEYNDIVTKTIEGEVIDVALPFYGKYDIVKPTEQDILNIYHLKTSFYTIIGPFALGYLVGGKKIDEKLQNVLDKIGISFQIKDDILGIFGSKSKIGKSNTSDISEFKQTILYTYIINTPYKEEFLKIYGNKVITTKDLNKVRNLLKISGSYDYAISYLEELYSNAILEIDDLDLEEECKDLLKGLLIYLHNRKK